PRERLAAILTDPRNDRLGQVVANRVWARYFGFGIVDPVDDWSDTTASHPELLRWLAHELITHDYDLKHLARLIFNSHAYQRTPTAESSRAVRSSERTFAAPARRRLSAVQLVDSLFFAAGKSFASEPLTFDPEARQNSRDQGHL